MDLPTPITLVKALEQAAIAIGVAGRALHEHSKGEVGFLAVKAARLDFHFDMTVTVDRTDKQAGLGVRNALFGPTVATEARRATSANRGSITLEIVAVTPSPESAARTVAGPKPAPKPVPKGEPVPAPPEIAPKDLSALAEKLKALRGALAVTDWPEERTRRVSALVDVAEATAKAGDLKGAEAVLVLLAEALATTPPPPAPPAPPRGGRGSRQPGG